MKTLVVILFTLNMALLGVNCMCLIKNDKPHIPQIPQVIYIDTCTASPYDTLYLQAHPSTDSLRIVK